MIMIIITETITTVLVTTWSKHSDDHLYDTIFAHF